MKMKSLSSLMLVTILMILCQTATAEANGEPKMKSLVPTVKLNSGYEMPVLGLGTWTLTGDTCENAVYAALKSGYIAIPGSSNTAHIAENFDVWDFELTDENMKKLTALNTGRRYENW